MSSVPPLFLIINVPLVSVMIAVCPKQPMLWESLIVFYIPFLYISLYSEIVEMYYGNYIIFYWLYTGKYTHTLQVLLLRKKKRYEIIAVILWSCDIFTLIFSTLLQAPESWLDQMHPIDKSVSYVYFTSEQIIETLSIGGK